MVGVGVFDSVSGVSRVKLTSAQFPNNSPTELRKSSSTSHNVITLVGWQMYKLPKSCSKRASPPAQLPHFHLARHLTAEKVEETLVAEQVEDSMSAEKPGRDRGRAGGCLRVGRSLQLVAENPDDIRVSKDQDFPLTL